jgi:hypothetical protein
MNHAGDKETGAHSRGSICMHGSLKLNCHTLTHSHLELGRALTASMPAAARLHCILHARDLRMLALVFGLCRWSSNFDRLFLRLLPNRTNFPFKHSLEALIMLRLCLFRREAVVKRVPPPLDTYKNTSLLHCSCPRHNWHAAACHGAVAQGVRVRPRPLRARPACGRMPRPRPLRHRGGVLSKNFDRTPPLGRGMWPRTGAGWCRLMQGWYGQGAGTSGGRLWLFSAPRPHGRCCCRRSGCRPCIARTTGMRPLACRARTRTMCVCVCVCVCGYTIYIYMHV